MDPSVRDGPRVSVVGASSPPDPVREAARRVGAGLAGLDPAPVLVTGGLGGVMEAASRGYDEAGGPLVVGVLPGEDRAAANPHVDVAVATGLGHARNALVPMNGDAVVALPGGGGTLSEVGLSRVLDRPLVAVDAWHELEDVETVEGPEAAVGAVAEALDLEA